MVIRAQRPVRIMDRVPFPSPRCGERADRPSAAPKPAKTTPMAAATTAPAKIAAQST
jgi:hypothetical protein